MNFDKSKSAPIKEDLSQNLEIPTEHKDIIEFIKQSNKLKPEGLFIDELKWRFLIRSAIRGQNILMVGHAGCGKTVTAKSVQKAFKGRPEFYFNLGATQDPRSTLIGNTHFKKEDGTFFAESLFVKAIRTENAIILLDEISRAHPDAWNILMTVLDQKQRYLRLDEKDNCETVPVAAGVTFIGTANIGSEYTATRVLDRALIDRFEIAEIDLLNAAQEFKLLKYTYPGVKDESLQAIAAIAALTREEILKDAPKISTIMTTRMSVDMAGLLYDGFTLAEAAQVAIFPFYGTENGNGSERTFIKQMVQKYVTVDKATSKEIDALFSDDEMDNAIQK